MNRAAEEFEPVWAAGFMSGTSLDAVDAAMILTDGERVLDFGPVAEHPFTAVERASLAAAVRAARDWNWQGEPPEAAFDAARTVLTRTHLQAWQKLLSHWDGPAPVLAGVHGQTVLHRRPQKNSEGASLQILDAVRLQQALGRPMAYDFRSADVAAGGEGAPLAPAYHAALMERMETGGTVFLNLGGVANLTARQRDGSLVAFDTGPANGPLDEWIAQHGKGSHDAGGACAAAGRIDEDRLARLLAHDYFAAPPPKSLDRYDFPAAMVEGLSLEDGAATLTAFTARSVAIGLDALETAAECVIACGGGRHNPTLMAMLADALPCKLMTAEDARLRGDSIEAEAFAFLAVRTLRGLPISWPGTTGVPQPMTGGEIIG